MLEVLRIPLPSPVSRGRPHLSLSASTVSTWDASVDALQFVYNRLYWCGAREVTVLPYGIIRGLVKGASACGVPASDTTLVLPDLRCCDPPLGSSPPRDIVAAWRFVDAGETALRKVHDAGVVHGDLCLSNILHQYVNGQFEIKFIDFDASFLAVIPCPASYDLSKRKLYLLCKQELAHGGKSDVVALNCTLDTAEVQSMRHCLNTPDGLRAWRLAAEKAQVGNLNAFSRWMAAQYDAKLETVSYSTAEASADETKQAGAARVAGCILD